MKWNPLIDIWLIVLAGAGVVVSATASVWRSATLTRRWLRAPVWILRLIAIAILLAILCNPVRRRMASASAADTREVLLVDTSASMTLEKPQSRFARAMKWSREVQAAAAGWNCHIVGFADDVNFDAEPSPGGASTRLAHALRRVLEGDPENRLANIVVVSDGRIHDRDELAASLALAQERHVAISTHTVGRDEAPMNVFIRACHVERSAPAGSPVAADIEIGARGLEAGAGVLEVSLKDESGAVLATAPMTLRAGVASKQLTFKAGPRTASYTVSVTRLSDELTYADNDFTFTLEIADPKIRVLYFEGSNDISGGANDEHWNFCEYMINAWKRAGDIECDAFVVPRGRQYTQGRTVAFVRGFDENHWPIHDPARALPGTRAGWFDYDLVICSDVLKDNFTPEQLDWVVELVTERGGGFCMIGGNTSFDTGKWHQTAWEKIVPVDMMEFGFGHQWNRVRPVFPESAFAHPIMQVDPDPERNRRAFVVHPQFAGFHDIRRAKPGATVLALREGTTSPLIAVQTYGKGRSMAFLSDSTGGWGEEYANQWGPELLGLKKRTRSDGDVHPPSEKPNQYYNRFWVNTVRWLAEKSVRRQHKEVVGRSEAINYRPGDVVRVAAALPSVFDPASLPGQSVGARLAIEGQPRVQLSYDRNRKEFIGQLRLPATIGSSEVGVIFDSTSEHGPISDQIRLRMMQQNIEFENPRPDAQFMADLAEAGGGAILDNPADAPRFFQQHQRAANAERVPYSEPLWNTPRVWSALLTLLTTEWLLRRLAAT